MLMKKLTIKEVAEKFGVGKRVASGWVERGKFPNAEKLDDPYGKSYWVIPETDLENFVPQKRKGKPAKENPSKATLAKRESRKNIKG